MDALDLLGKRIDAFSRMVGPIPDSNIHSTEDIVESLLSAQALLQDAVKSRPQNINVIDRALELENYLSPNFLEESQNIRTKEIYLSAITPDLIVTCEQLEQIKKLEPALGAEYFRNIPSECTDKLNQLVIDNVEFSQQSELIEESLILIMKRYGELQSALLGSLSEMSKRLEVLEERLQQRKKDGLVKDLVLTESGTN